MGVLQEARRGLSNISSFRQEQSAVPSARTGPVLKRFAQRTGAELGRQSAFGNQRLRNRFERENIDKDIKDANIDAAVSLPLTAVRAGLDIREAKKQDELRKTQEVESERVLGILSDLGELYRTHPIRVRDALKSFNVIQQPPTVGGGV